MVRRPLGFENFQLPNYLNNALEGSHSVPVAKLSFGVSNSPLFSIKRPELLSVCTSLTCDMKIVQSAI